MKMFRIGCLVLSAAAFGSPRTAAQQRPAKPTAKPTPAGAAQATVEVSVAGVRVVGTGYGANGSELRAFNERPGTTIVLALLAPAGGGIVEIDNRASRVDAFADDKGQSLLEEGQVGSFPKIAEDHSAALVEVGVQARPAAGAVSVVAQGSVAVTLAKGSKPQRIPNVRLEAGQTMKLGTATVSMKTATPGEESASVGLALTRATLTTIREIRFLTVKGAPIESRRTSSGYFNDAAEVEFTVKTKEKLVAVEFDVWQNLRQVTVPFNVTVGLGLPGGRGGAAAEPKGQASGGSAPAAAKAAPKAPKIAPAPGDGGASVEAVVTRMQTGASSGKASEFLAAMLPDDRPTFAQGLAMAVTFSLMAHIGDDKASEKAQQDVDALFAKHKIKPPLSGEPVEIFKNTDLTAFTTDAFAYLKAQVPKGQDASGAIPVPKGKPQDVKITGDSAVAKLDGHDVNFTSVNGRWFIRLE
jgi:hypothetical protein